MEMGSIIGDYANVKVHGIFWGRIGQREGLVITRRKPMQEPQQPRGNGGHRFSVFSNKSFASLILLAMYGEPPRSGWFANMMCLCASFNLFRSVGPSLRSYVNNKNRLLRIMRRLPTHLSPRIATASLRSILALKPPFTH